ncbi:hypothetical protein [Xenorhabdus szentirmaii]|uniref:hypothetical protein n=1 Tax=Xenorhabdus szentirmaii TaxID=290112 RepID=UPI0011459ECF|nr:hypothetical protein [Xenorhabdus szentirmaii]
MNGSKVLMLKSADHVEYPEIIHKTFSGGFSLQKKRKETVWSASFSARSKQIINAFLMKNSSRCFMNAFKRHMLAMR